MLRTRMAFSGMALKAAGQVGASVAATLIAAMIFSALPRATVPVAHVAAELTSGGKFAARVPGVESVAAEAQAVREQRPVLPMMAETPAQAIPLSAADASWDEAAKPLQPSAGENLGRPRLHLPARGDAGRLMEIGTGAGTRAAAAVAALASKPAASAPIEAAAAKTEDGMLPRVAASARFFWSLTASAGESLLSRLIP